MSKLPNELINKIFYEFKGLESPTATIIKNKIIEINDDGTEILDDLYNMSDELIFNRTRYDQFHKITGLTEYNDYVDFVVKTK